VVSTLLFTKYEAKAIALKIAYEMILAASASPSVSFESLPTIDWLLLA
jgi:hypothetical protein